MNTLRLRALLPQLLLPALALAPVSAALAQQRAAVPEPPRLEKLEEGEAPAVTIPGRQSEQQIEERRDHGEVTSIKVTSGGSTYYVKPNKPKGSAQPGDLQSTANQPAQWQIFEFNTERRKDLPPEESNTAAPASAPAAGSGR